MKIPATTENIEKLIGIFEKILKQNIKDAETTINKALCLADLGRCDESVDEFEKVLREEPDKMNALNFKAKSAANLQDYDLAFSLISKLLKLEDKHDHHQHVHDHEHFLERIKKDSDFTSLKNNSNFIALYD